MDANDINSYMVPIAVSKNIALGANLLINKAHYKMSSSGPIFPLWGKIQLMLLCDMFEGTELGDRR